MRSASSLALSSVVSTSRQAKSSPPMRPGEPAPDMSSSKRTLSTPQIRSWQIFEEVGCREARSEVERDERFVFDNSKQPRQQGRTRRSPNTTRAHQKPSPLPSPMMV
jgi:hypothetical protein